MKLKLILIVCTFLVLSLITGVILIRSADDHNWNGYSKYQLSLIASWVEAFREIKGYYPNSLAELKMDSSFSSEKALQENLAAASGQNLSYELTSNGFALTSVKSNRFIFPRKVIKVEYRKGEATRIGEFKSQSNR